jgi:hypothetical protein
MIRNPFRPPCPCPAAPPAADRGGNVLWIMGFMIVPLVFATGFGIDYGRAQQTQTKLNAIADLRLWWRCRPTSWAHR